MMTVKHKLNRNIQYWLLQPIYNSSKNSLQHNHSRKVVYHTRASSNNSIIQ